MGECIGFAAAMCCLRGRAFEALDNGPRAAACFSSALRADPFCYEAFQVPLSGAPAAACSPAPLTHISPPA